MSASVTNDSRPIDPSEHELLIVDDDPASRYATQRRLAAAGFRVLEAATGAEALAYANSSLSAIVLDIHLPDIDGFELSRRLRSNPPTSHIPILHLTAAYVTDDDKVRGLYAGADAYLTHPVEPAVLVATVLALVRTRVAETAMRTSEAKFRAIYANAPSGICLLDRDGRFLDANPAMLKSLGRPLADVVGRSLAEFAVPAEVAKVPVLTRPRTHDDVAADAPEQLMLLDHAGSEVPLEWRVSSLSDDVVLAQVTDITERMVNEHVKQQLLESERTARTSAEQLSRMKDEFIAVLSHELRSPLNAIMGWVHVLIQRGGSDETMEGLRAIERNGKAQTRLISDLLDVSRANVGKMRLMRTPLDLADVVRSAAAALDAASEENGTVVHIQAEEPLPKVYGDAARLQQVMWNLLSNAIKFSPKGGRIDIVCTRDGDGVRVDVRDGGQGIDAEFLPHVFDRFTQASSVNRRYRSGLGLGLSIVQTLVQAHGGSVTVSSAGLGRGATFQVWLPLGDSFEAGELDATGIKSPLQGLRLLLIDDDPEALAMLQIILADSGAGIECARDCDEALQALQRSSPDLIVCDIGLPGRDGYQLIEEVRRGESPGSRVPALALTAFAQRQDRLRALEAGFDAHLTKPLRPLQLVQLITQLVGRGRVATKTH
ncbi:MAG TPA: response regulator [Rubrivivax sp.]